MTRDGKRRGPQLSPTVARRELVVRLTARQAELGLRTADITSHLGFSPNYWSQIINEKALLARDRLASLLKLLDLDDTTARELIDLRERARVKAWWDEFEDVFEEPARYLFGLEQGASEIKSSESLVIPWLLQTEAYARAFITSDPMFAPVDVERAVEFRLHRQRRLLERDNLQYTTVLSEAALLQQVGGAGVQREQLEHIIDTVGATDKINLRIIPFTSNPGPVIGSSTLEIIEFDSPHLEAVAWQEAIWPIGLIDSTEQVRRLDLVFSRGLQASLETEASLQLTLRSLEQMSA